MLQLCFKNLKKKQKDVITIILSVFALSLVSVIAFTSANNIIDKKREAAFDSYGTFVAGGFSDKIDSIPYADELDVGICNIIDNSDYMKKTASIGIVNENFCKLSNCKVIAGRMPQKKNEIVVQKYYLSLLGKNVGDIIMLNLAGKQDSFTIVGVVNNYSMNLSTSANESEVNVYPTIIVSDEYAGDTKKISYIIGFKNTDDLKPDDLYMIQKINRLAGTDNFDFYNDNLFYKGFQYCNELELYSKIFTIFVFFIASVICAILYRFFFKKIRIQSAIFSALGGVRFFRKLIIMQVILITSLAFIITLVSFTVINNMIFHGRILLFISGLKYLCFWYLIYVISMLAISILYLILASRNSVRENLRVRSGTKKDIIYFKTATVIKYFMVFIITFLCIFYIKVLHESFIGFPDYDLVSQDMEVSEIVKGYTLKYNTLSVYDNSELDKILNKYSDINVKIKPNLANNTLAFYADYDNDYLKTVNEVFSFGDTEVENSFYVNNWSREADKYVPVQNVQYLIVSNSEYDNIKKVSNAPKSGTGVLIYIPSQHQDIDKNKLAFVGFERDENELQFIKYDLKADDILYKENASIIYANTKEYSDGFFDPIDEDKLTVLLNYDYISEYRIIKGYESVSVTLDSGFTQFDAIDDDMAFLQSGIQGGTLYSTKEDEKKAESYNNYVRTVSITLIIISGIIALVYSVCDAMLYIKKNRRRLGIMMVLGKTKGSLATGKALYNIEYYIISVLLGILIIMVSVFDGDNGSLCITVGGISCAVTAVVMLTENVIFNLFLKRVSLKECIYQA